MNAVESLLRAHIRDARQAIATANARVDALEELTNRLSTYAPPEPGERMRSTDGWTAEEDAVLIEHYPTIGAPGCHEMLPHRSTGALRTRASRKLKLRVKQ